MINHKKPIIVIGHKNPDTDSVCSAIAYANLKSNISEPDEIYEAMRAGHLNEETQYVLNKFGIQPPQYIKDVRTQVKDIEIRKTEGVLRSISIKEAWTLMKEANVVTLPITVGNDLEGLITIGDIAKSYMEEHDSRILATAHTKYKNILDTLDGSMIVGNEDEYFTNGKVLIAAANPDMMENYIEPDDLVILGNRYESQLCAIEMDASCIIICEGSTVCTTIRKLAEQKNCKIISTPHDTYTVARLINQSIPISYFMKRNNLITFCTEDFIDDIQEVMAKKRHRDFPIHDREGNHVGMISRRNLLGANKKRMILVDHNERNQAVDGIEEAEILEIIDHHRLGTIETISPVFFRNQPLGCTATIIYKMYKEYRINIDKTIAGLLCSAIISDTLMFRSPTCTEIDQQSAMELAVIAEIDVEDYAKEMFNAGSNLSSKSEKEIFYQDFKKFSFNDVIFGIGQINSMNQEELLEIRGRMIPFVTSFMENNELDMIFFMLTDIMEESSELIFAGNHAKELIENAFNVVCSEESAKLKGVVSRKKQLIPAIMETLQQ